jgi:hypothetical protein
MTLPAMVAKPPAMTAWSCERVIAGRNGRTKSGASVWPTKMLAAAETASDPVTPGPSDLRRTHATPATTTCITPRW